MKFNLLDNNMLFIANIIFSPVLSLLFFSQTTLFIPNFIFITDNTLIEIILRVTYFSVGISIISLLVLLIKRESKINKILFYVLTPVIISAFLAPVTLPAITMLFYILGG